MPDDQIERPNRSSASARAVLSFPEFVDAYGPKLQRALIARFGADRGVEAAAEALAFAWETWPRCLDLANPVAYLFSASNVARVRFRLREGRNSAEMTHIHCR